METLYIETCYPAIKKRLESDYQLLELRIKALREEGNRSAPKILGNDQRGYYKWLINRHFKNCSSVLRNLLWWCREVVPLRAPEKQKLCKQSSVGGQDIKICQSHSTGQHTPLAPLLGNKQFPFARRI